MENDEQNTRFTKEEITYPISSLVVGQLMADETDINSLVSFFYADPTKLDKKNTILPYLFLFHKEKCTFEQDGEIGYGVHYVNIFCPTMSFIMATEETHVDKLYQNSCLTNENILPLSFFTEQERKEDQVTLERLFQCLLALNYQQGFYDSLGMEPPSYQYKI